MTSRPIALRTTDLHRSFGAVPAVSEVHLTVGAGARHALIGPNGAGKSTVFRLLTGAMRVTAGVVEFAGRDVTGLSEARRCRLGMSQTPQHTSLFASMTAIETVELAVRRHEKGRVSLRGRPLVRERAEKLLADAGLIRRRDVLGPALSYGERRQLEVALALACRPTLLLLDEPAAGLSGAERARLVHQLEGLPPELTVLFVEHDLDLVFALADLVTVLHRGRVLMTGPPARIRASGAVREAYFGAGRREELFR